MALENNKQMQVSRVKQSIAENQRKSARTKYLPRVSALGAYEYTNRGISLLKRSRKHCSTIWVEYSPRPLNVK